MSDRRFDTTHRAPVPYRHEGSASQQMNDPHAVALYCRIEHAAWVDGSTAKPLELHENAFDVRVADKRGHFRMKEHHEIECAARRSGENCLRASELHAALQHGSYAFELRFVRSEIVNRNARPGAVHTQAGSVTFTAKEVAVRETVSPSSYPAPPSTDLRSNPDIENMFCRYAGYRDRREPLTAMAYFCLTVLEASAGSRQNAAGRYCVSKPVSGSAWEPELEQGRSRRQKGGWRPTGPDRAGKPVPGSNRQGDHPKAGRVCIRPGRISQAHNHARPSSPASAFLQSVAGTPDSRSSCLAALPFVRGTHFCP